MSFTYNQLLDAAYKFDKADRQDRVIDCLWNLYVLDKKETLPHIMEFRDKLQKRAKNGENVVQFHKLLKRSYILTARDIFDDYLIAVEWDKPYKEKFYLPRRGYLKRIGLIDGYQDVLDGKLDVLTASLPKRAGKAVTLDTLIPTPFGLKPMRDIKVGDLVMARDGYETKVTDVFPQGKVPIYEVKFSDGAVVKTCGEHLWKVRYHLWNEHCGGYEHRVMSTKEILDSGIKSIGKNAHNVFSIEYSEPAEFMYKEVKLDPYVLGVLIGDGCLKERTISLVNYDKEVTEYVRNNLPEGDEMYLQDKEKMKWCIRSKERKYDEAGHPLPTKTRQYLEELGLYGKLSWEKHIPKEYLYTTSPMRWELLAGLLDTDGYCENKGIEYSTASPYLASDVVFLVRSLGGKCNCSSRMGKYLKNGKVIETRENYRVHIQFAKGISPFKLTRKRDKYKPQREQLYHYIESITPCGEEEAQCICVDNEEHLFLVSDYFIPTHNSQTGINFVNMLSGRNPERASLMEGTGDDLIDSFYKGCLQYIQPENGYCFNEIFPNAKLIQTKADTHIIDLGERSRFPTIMCRSIDARQVGLSEATNCLYLDDCVDGRKEAKNRAILESKWSVINGDILGRAIEGTPIIATGTRYSIYDPIGKLQEKAANNGLRIKTIEVPALDEVTDESNYEYYNPKLERKVFTTAYFRNERNSLLSEQFESEFQQHPFEAKGILFPKKELHRFFELPADKDADSVIAVCDTAEGGGDSVMLPIAYIYGEDVFIADCVFDNSTPEHTKPQCAKKLVEHKVVRATFESNNAGTYYARDVDRLVKSMGGRCSIKTKRTISNKQTRIELASDNILKHFYFLDESLYERNSQYGLMMKEIYEYTRTGKVEHDDAPDGLSLLENEIRSIKNAVTIKVVDRYF